MTPAQTEMSNVTKSADAIRVPGAHGACCTASVGSTLLQFLRFSRQREWLCSSMLPLFGTFLLAGFRDPSKLSPGNVAGWLLIVGLATGCGYMLNNLADLEVDRRAGKANPLGHWTYSARLAVALTFEASSLYLTVKLSDFWTLAVVVFFHLVMWLYSFPPRFKENRWLGPLAAATQFWAPSAVILIAWHVAFPAAICWVAILSMYGVRLALIHQVLDRENDVVSGVVTSVVTMSESGIRALLRGVFSAEISLCLLLVVLLLRESQVIFTFPLLFLPIANFWWRRRHRQQIRLDTYEYVPASELYETVLPVMFGLSLFARNGASVAWALVFLLLLLLVRHAGRFTFAANGIHSLRKSR